MSTAKVYAAAPTFGDAIIVNSVDTTLPSRSDCAGAPAAFRCPKPRGSTPATGIDASSSPLMNNQPLRQPKQLHTAQSARNQPATLPQDTAMKSEIGAADAATVASGSINATAQVAMTVMNALNPVPSMVAVGRLRSGFSTTSAGTAALSKPSIAYIVNPTAAEAPAKLNESACTGGSADPPGTKSRPPQRPGAARNRRSFT